MLFAVAMLLATLATVSSASDARMTPLVRAVERVKASVANIHSEKTASQGDSLFSTSRPRKISGMGTGIIVDPRGYIVTNHHVIKDVDSLRVTLVDGSTYEARIVGFDAKHDLAVIKIEPTRPLPVVPIGTSSDLMLGETVIAIGNAYGYEHTVTAGIVSALARDVEVNEQQSYQNLIQTDASINPGNSGGPLINLDGDVVGINVAIRAGAQRIGFAIPIDDARKIVADLLSVEQLEGRYHGLIARDVKSASKRELVVVAAQANSPAEKAGFREGDVVLKVGEVEVRDRADFERALLDRDDDDPVNVVVRRNDETETLALTLTELHTTVSARSESSGKTVPRKQRVKDRAWKTLGFRLSRLSPVSHELAGTQYRGGLRVTAVRPGSPAARNGIRPGDILVGLHIWETVSHENVSYVLEHPRLRSFDPLKFYIIRGRETLYGYLHLPDDAP